MSKSNYLENKVLDHVYGGGDYARPATVYLALFTAAPTDAGGGTEVAGNAYARAAITSNSTNFPAAASGVKSNGTPIVFAEATGAWGTVTHWALFDALSGGNMLNWGVLNTPKTVASGDQPQVNTGGIVITED